MSKTPSRVVFVGNIHYNLSEEQITDIFNSAGRVVSFRLVYDPQTGKTRGYGFAEYPDVDSAASAVRNLHDFEVMGRKLKVDFSNERQTADDDASGPSHPISNGHASNVVSGSGSSSLPSLPPGKDLPSGVTFTDAVSRTLTALPPSQLLDILAQMKILASSDPGRATELLQQAPQLAYAVFQAMLLMNLLSPEAIQSVIDSGGPPAYSAPSMQYPSGGVPTPSVRPLAYSLPAPTMAPALVGYAPPLPMPAQDPEALMRAVMSLPQSTIDALSDIERQQIMALRSSYAAQQR